MRPVTDVELRHSLKNTNNKAPGFSGIRIIPFRCAPPNYFRIIQLLFTSIIASKYWPQKFKSSKMIFAPKQGKPLTNPLNYRPISLLEVLAKVFERIISNRLMLYLEFNNMLPPNQFGFRPGRSTQHSIQIAIEAIKESRDQGRAVLVATRDIAKAFDTVYLEGLLFKINTKLQLDLNFTSFIYNYVFNRRISPTFDNKFGPSFTPKAGVPQGSCLGPILFLMFVHDLPQPLYNDSLIFQFADDIVHVIRSDSTGVNKALSVQSKLRRELIRTLEWEERWKVKNSFEKNHISYSGTSLVTLENIGGIVIRGNHIPIDNSIKMLGYTFSHLIRSSVHILNIINRSQACLAKMYRFRSAPESIKRYLYITLIRPLLEYPCVQLNKAGIRDKSKLQKIQNKALRFICNVNLRDRVRSEALHDHCKIDPINVRLAKLSCRTLYAMKDLYINDPDFETAPFMRHAVDYEMWDMEPIRPPPPSLSSHIHNVIFSLGYDRQPALSSLPDDREDYIIPPPKFT